MQVDDAMLMAWLDGELDELTGRRIEAALEQDAALAARLEAQRRLKARLAAHYDPVAGEPVPKRFSALLDSNVVTLTSPPARRPAPLWRNAAALAATLVLGLFIGRAMPSGEPGPVGFEANRLVAQGALAEALDSQLASAPIVGAATRIGVSFARADGSPCRTFANPVLSGLACREGGRWRMVATEARTEGGAGEYRQASAASPRTLQAAQELMAGEPFDADSERRARDSGWRSSR